jgi:alpha-1,2-mannosyltransferase
MFGQSLGSVILGFEALCKTSPHVFIDTMGYSWTFPIFSILGGSYVAAYVHYPTISTDMLSKVSSRSNSFNNDARIASSGLKTEIKILYYRLFAAIYSWMGSFSELTMVNSSWTRDHIVHIWKPSVLELVYPPCDTSGLQPLKLEGRNRKRLVSIAQFRPEKNHFLQIEIIDALIKSSPTKFKDIQLHMIGSMRSGNAQDLALVDHLKAEISKRNLEQNVFIATGVSNDVLKQHFAQASIGLHTMTQEHFGIGIVELQAAGVVPLAHNSAGPKADIVVHQTGFLADSLQEYVSCLTEMLELSDSQFMEIAKKAKQNARRFSDETFVEHINRCYKMIPSLAQRL